MKSVIVDVIPEGEKVVETFASSRFVPGSIAGNRTIGRVETVAEFAGPLVTVRDYLAEHDPVLLAEHEASHPVDLDEPSYLYKRVTEIQDFPYGFQEVGSAEEFNALAPVYVSQPLNDGQPTDGRAQSNNGNQGRKAA